MAPCMHSGVLGPRHITKQLHLTFFIREDAQTTTVPLLCGAGLHWGHLLAWRRGHHTQQPHRSVPGRKAAWLQHRLRGCACVRSALALARGLACTAPTPRRVACPHPTPPPPLQCARAWRLWSAWAWRCPTKLWLLTKSRGTSWGIAHSKGSRQPASLPCPTRAPAMYCNDHRALLLHGRGRALQAGVLKECWRTPRHQIESRKVR